jgi:hypothetical protein
MLTHSSATFLGSVPESPSQHCLQYVATAATVVRIALAKMLLVAVTFLDGLVDINDFY